MPKGMKFVRIGNTQLNSKNIYTATGLIGKKIKHRNRQLLESQCIIVFNLDMD
jgi:hypothetical protein